MASSPSRRGADFCFGAARADHILRLPERMNKRAQEIVIFRRRRARTATHLTPRVSLTK